MDWRLGLLLHVQLGLKLNLTEVDLLTSTALELASPDQALSCVSSHEALRYFAEKKDWWKTSGQIVKQSASSNVRWVYRGQADYPRLWNDLSHQPIIFSYQGHPCWNDRPWISVVGSRNPMSSTCQWLQGELAAFLRASNWGVVSGGARGIDQWAHRIATDVNVPTICVFPGGLLRPYPDQCEHIWRRILNAGGALISTFSLNEELRRWSFAVRNRWIAGLGSICLVAEANRRSGSFLTAGLAMQEGRTLCTLPVSPTGEKGLANLDLLFDGAQLLRTHKDLLALAATSSCALRS